MIRALVFDFDGLILDTEEPIYRSWLEVYQAHGETLPFERWVQTVGSTNTQFHPQHHLEERLGRPLAQEVLDVRVGRRTEMILAQQVLPGILQHIDDAGALGLKLGVASSSTRHWVGGHLERLGILGRFDCVRVSPAEAVAIEDSPNGVMAAKQAGMFCVAIPKPIQASPDLSQADLVLRSLSDVPLRELLQRLDSSATP